MARKSVIKTTQEDNIKTVVVIVSVYSVQQIFPCVRLCAVTAEDSIVICLVFLVTKIAY